MNKKEVLWREILHQTIKNNNNLTQKNLAKKFGVSLSTVHNSLKLPRKTGAVDVSGKGFKVTDIEKLLYLWATFRNLKKDKIYSTYVNKPARNIENQMPPNIIYGAFSAYTKKYEDIPADYDKVYIYSTQKNLQEIKKRFPKKKGRKNLFVLKADPWLKKFGPITPDVQTFVDLWNINDWFAKDFANSLKEKIIYA